MPDRGRRLLAAILLAWLAPLPSQAASMFQASLDSAQAVLPAGSSASTVTGSASLVLTATGLAYDVRIGPGLDFGPIAGGSASGGDEVIGFHLHTGTRDTAFGAIVFGILAPDSDTDGDTMVSFESDGSTRIQGEWDNAEGNGSFSLGSFLDGLGTASPGEDTALYFNLHSEADPVGAIRGHVVAVPEPGILLQLLMGLVGLSACWRHSDAFEDPETR